MAQAGKDECLTFMKIAEDPKDLIMLVFHDAAWANVSPQEGEESVNVLEDAEEVQPGVYSQMGYVVMVTSLKALWGEKARASILSWRSRMPTSVPLDLHSRDHGGA